MNSSQEAPFGYKLGSDKAQHDVITGTIERQMPRIDLPQPSEPTAPAIDWEAAHDPLKYSRWQQIEISAVEAGIMPDPSRDWIYDDLGRPIGFQTNSNKEIDF